MSPGDTIIALSSTIGPAYRQIVRLCGPDAFARARPLCDPFPGTRGASRCRLRLDDLSIPIHLYRFDAPRSYTGEDLLEFHLPASALIARLLLDALQASGIRPAEPGEFTARAYFNGRLDLTRAEGVAATIAAANDRQLRAARQLLAGALAQRLQPLLDGLAQTLALLEAGIDFSEEDISFLSAADLQQQVAHIDESLEKLLGESTRFDRLAHEPRAVLVGRPNAGKSTLLNALARQQRAIVSAIPGTTRDALTADLHLPHGTLRLVDVAGLDNPDPGDSIAVQMRRRALQELESADIVLLVHDGSTQDPPIAVSRCPDLTIHTKSDLITDPTPADALLISSHTGHNLDVLLSRLDALLLGQSQPAAQLALNARHLAAIGDCRTALHRIDPAAPAEITAQELRSALDALGQILGAVTPEDLLGRIFSRFCIGK